MAAISRDGAAEAKENSREATRVIALRDRRVAECFQETASGVHVWRFPIFPTLFPFGDDERRRFEYTIIYLDPEISGISMFVPLLVFELIIRASIPETETEMPVEFPLPRCLARRTLS